ncbi:hypothetical protein C2S52_009890 [Perilla frutescens var. hirtella]|nr:hypothetical protein C2S52_009890 [Perilla frutescens var. hirtella]
MEGGGERRIELFCPSVCRAIQIVAEEEQKPDLGSISRAFGLDPNTLKLNGYFISRGPDLIASSVTWSSLIRFFSARSLPTGAAGSAALLVDGKLSKIGPKRSHDVEDGGNVIGNKLRESKRPQHERCSVQDSHESSGSCSKRKLVSEDESRRLKRPRSDEAASGLPFSCSIISKNLKRMRVDEIVAAPPSKKLR